MKEHEVLRSLARSQHGLVARWQCRLVALHGNDVRWLLGEWEHVSPRVLRLVGAPRSDEQRVLEAVLDAGAAAVASHRTAAAIWRFPGFALGGTVDVSRPRSGTREPSSLARLHHPRALATQHVTVVHDIPVTTPARTLFDLAGVLSPMRVERALDNALAASPGLIRALHRMLPELAERGRTGIRTMRRLLDERPLGYLAPASGLEARVIRLLEEAGIRARRQVDIGGDDWIGRVDLLVEGSDLIVEVDSARYHSSLLDRRRDAERDEHAHRTGFRIVRVTEEQAWTSPSTVVSAVWQALHPSGERIWRSCARSAHQNAGRGVSGSVSW